MKPLTHKKKALPIQIMLLKIVFYLLRLDYSLLNKAE
ncbi:hypothetical protein HMPREF9714_01946 [Myroides odoratimimus CCUG 12901]|uniref:Uncharacterized protein n=2 Tax=Myroides odoratimimus TaxID=76832 RepID=A0ABN0E6U2_9FLAO|nr:hypothetical protein HMPREF9712_03310 [Myroides odoratimimus CCUG 10230]EHO09268.1 hypothetical protein HMPREF9714_01946 [Myroides odoratimimus CCUG 12901]EHO11643.1 hypothetical protein HMPREF9715_01992 [Myroides odoratimimus CIP 101113]EKB06289.1 hypothetical protein HMPREF9711_00661 [Myroides odoratimimus CCUG 3837]EPH13232.1 hypothetical protein HMPREF9713_00967 [Myroides odoratimimus CCUG 12700]SHL64017.1 hypothetical protein SAMN05444275_105243 [Myroides odoratimimus subsp. xuanwuensi